MIPIQELLFAIDNKANSLANLKGKYIPDETKIEVLNLVQTRLILNKLGINNEYRSGIDSFNVRYEDLQTLIVNYEKLSVTSTGDQLNSYTTPFTDLSQDMFVPIGMYVTADRGGCTGRLLDVKEIVKHEDLRIKLISPHYKPSFNYQETLAVVTSDIIYVYGQPDFKITNLYLSYLRYPVLMDVVGYIHLDGTSSVNQNCELDYYLLNELVDLAVEEIADSTGNQSQSQLSRARQKANE